MCVVGIGLRVALVLLVAFAATAARAADFTVRVETVEARDGPGASHRSVVRLERGTAVKALEHSGEWSRVRLSEGKEGWVPTRALKSDVEGLKVCNKNASSIAVAIAYEEGGARVSEGWWNIAPGACTVVLAGELRQRYYYAHVINYDDTKVWSGKDHFCTGDKSYRILEHDRCDQPGLRKRGFLRIDTHQCFGWTVRF